MLEENTQPQVEEEEEKEVVTEVEETQKEPKQTFKVKHLHEEKEIPYDEAPTYIQKGLDYDRVKNKYESSKSTLDFVENLARQQGMDVNDYIKAVNDNQRQQEIESLANANGLDNEMAEELYLLRQERKDRTKREQEYQRKEQENQEYMNFFKEFPDVSAEQIPSEVFELRSKNPGMSLSDAYIRNEYNALKNKTKTQEVNSKNSKNTTGSVTGNGDVKNDFITFDTFSKNKNDRSWVVKNLDKITKSRLKW